MSKKDEALKLAVEAAVEQYAKTGSGKVLDAAMRQIIANEALNKMAENAKELGLDYEPAQQQEPSHSDIQLAEQIMSDCGCSTNNQRLLERITERLAKHRPAQQQEPVAWLSTDCIGERYLCFTKPKDNDPVQPLYTTPPKRQWVGLTDEERRQILLDDPIDWIAAIEAKLKEKNHG